MAGFKVWLKRQKHRNDPVGDLARDAMRDRHWPPGAKLSRLEGYLGERGACKEAHEALYRAWREWQANERGDVPA